MKALISPQETFIHFWITSWKQVDGKWVVDTRDAIENCQRVAEVVPTAFDVAPPLFWVDCPNDCVADEWYYKDGVIEVKPQGVPKPE